jgi:two-component system response regulator VicR
MIKRRILLAEDNPTIAEVLADNLTFEGFDVHCVDDGRAAVKAAAEFLPDLVILDIMLPGIDGMEVCRQLRPRTHMAIMMLTALGDKDDRIRGLNLGADDYVTKPFHLEEVIARVQAVLRRTHPDVEELRLGTITIDFTRLRACDGARDLALTHQEFELLHYLATHQGTTIHRDELLMKVWRYPAAPLTRLVDRAIGRLRSKIEADPHHPRYIHTVHGEGYCLTPEGAPAKRR